MWHTKKGKHFSSFRIRSGRWPRMFFMILGTYRKQTFIDFSLTQRIQLMIFWCHTVTHGTDLRRSPHVERWLMAWIVLVATAPSSMHQTAQLKSWKQTRSKTIRRSWVTVFSTGKEVRLQLPRPGEGRRQTTLQKKTKIPASLIHPKMFCVKTVRF